MGGAQLPVGGVAVAIILALTAAAHYKHLFSEMGYDDELRPVDVRRPLVVTVHACAGGTQRSAQLKALPFKHEVEQQFKAKAMEAKCEKIVQGSTEDGSLMTICNGLLLSLIHI